MNLLLYNSFPPFPVPVDNCPPRHRTLNPALQAPLQSHGPLDVIIATISLPKIAFSVPSLLCDRIPVSRPATHISPFRTDLTPIALSRTAALLRQQNLYQPKQTPQTWHLSSPQVLASSWQFLLSSADGQAAPETATPDPVVTRPSSRSWAIRAPSPMAVRPSPAPLMEISSHIPPLAEATPKNLPDHFAR